MMTFWERCISSRLNTRHRISSSSNGFYRKSFAPPRKALLRVLLSVSEVNISTGGASGKTIHAVAVNDYKVSIPVADFNKYNVLLATSMNGKKLSRRDKGPIWVIYPKDDHPELANEFTDRKSIWQMVSIVVE